MNDVRRKTLRKVIELIEECQDMLEDIRDEEDEYLNNIPINLQNSERYEISEDAIYEMDDAISSLESAVDCIEGII